MIHISYVIHSQSLRHTIQAFMTLVTLSKLKIPVNVTYQWKIILFC